MEDKRKNILGLRLYHIASKKSCDILLGGNFDDACQRMIELIKDSYQKYEYYTAYDKDKAKLKGFLADYQTLQIEADANNEIVHIAVTDKEYSEFKYDMLLESGLCSYEKLENKMYMVRYQDVIEYDTTDEEEKSLIKEYLRPRLNNRPVRAVKYGPDYLIVDHDINRGCYSTYKTELINHRVMEEFKISCRNNTYRLNKDSIPDIIS